MSLVKISDTEDSLADIAKLLSEFFSEMDVVPSDLIAGMMLLRHKQKRAREKTLEEGENRTYEFLSGAAITPQTKFLDLRSKESLEHVRSIRYYMQFALAAYGWPFYLTNNKKAVFSDLLKGLRCCGCRRTPALEDGVVIEDNCCLCNLSALKLTLPSDQIELIYANFHCGDLITDLSADTEDIEVPNMRGANWLAHKGIVKASEYILNQVKDACLLEKAFEKLQTKSTDSPEPQLILVGHSLGGGIATIVGLMLRDLYPSLKCYVYSPPGGLLTWSAAEATRDFVWTTVVGKDVVARLGLAQMEVLKTEMMGLLKSCKDTKWKIIGHSLPCCRAEFTTESPEEPLLDHPDSPPMSTSPLLVQNNAITEGQVAEIEVTSSNDVTIKKSSVSSSSRPKREHP